MIVECLLCDGRLKDTLSITFFMDSPPPPQDALPLSCVVQPYYLLLHFIILRQGLNKLPRLHLNL